MISRWSEWKRFPRARGDNIEAPICPGIYEVRIASTGATFAYGTSDNLAQTLATLPLKARSFRTWFSRRAAVLIPELEYRTCATATRADAKAAADGMIGRRDTYMRGAA